MGKTNKKPSVKMAILLSCLFLLIPTLIVFVPTPPVIDSRGIIGRSSAAKVLDDIYEDMQAYRLVELEYVLSSGKMQTADYQYKMGLILQRLGKKTGRLETLLFSEEEKKAYKSFESLLGVYLEESKKLVALSKADFQQQNTARMAETLRPLFEKSIHSLGVLNEANTKYANSWSGWIRALYREKGLEFGLLYICSMTALIFLIFNLYEKPIRKISIHS
jgi:hypothetical protein